MRKDTADTTVASPVCVKLKSRDPNTARQLQQDARGVRKRWVVLPHICSPLAQCPRLEREASRISQRHARNRIGNV